MLEVIVWIILCVTTYFWIKFWEGERPCKCEGCRNHEPGWLSDEYKRRYPDHRRELFR